MHESEFPYMNTSSRDKVINSVLICTVTLVAIAIILIEITYMQVSLTVASKITNNDIGKTVLVILFCSAPLWCVPVVYGLWIVLNSLLSRYLKKHAGQTTDYNSLNETVEEDSKL